MSRSTRDGFDQPVVLRIDSSSADEEETLFYAALQGVAGFPLDLFHAYTVEQHCDENVNFYRQVEEYREAPQIPTRDGIVDTFVKPGKILLKPEVRCCASFPLCMLLFEQRRFQLSPMYASYLSSMPGDTHRLFRLA